MKSISNLFATTLVIACSLSTAQAQVTPAASIVFNPGQAPALLIYEDQPAQTVYIVNANATAILYKTTPMASENEPQLKLSDLQSVYIYEPKTYREAMELYQGRKYAEALPIFTKVSEDYKFSKGLPNNYSVLAGFYAMECMRRLGDLEALSKAAAAFDARGLSRSLQIRQFELYALWDAVRTKSWDRVVSIGEERMAEKQVAYQRAQVAYCLAQGYEAKKLTTKALNAFNMALIADIGASHEIAEQAAVAIMRIHLASPDVQTAMKNWGTDDENKASAGRMHLIEAGAVASIYQLTVGNGKPLPGQFNILLKYKPEKKASEISVDEPGSADKKNKKNP